MTLARIEVPEPCVEATEEDFMDIHALLEAHLSDGPLGEIQRPMLSNRQIMALMAMIELAILHS